MSVLAQTVLPMELPLWWLPLHIQGITIYSGMTVLTSKNFSYEIATIGYYCTLHYVYYMSVLAATILPMKLPPNTLLLYFIQYMSVLAATTLPMKLPLKRLLLYSTL